MENQFVKKKDGFEGQKAVIMPKSILTKLCAKNPIICNLYITDIGYYPKALNHYRKRLHGCEQHILIYCAEGKGIVDMNGTVYKVEAGNYIIIPKKTNHLYKADPKLPWSIYWVHFSGIGADALMQHLKSDKTYVGFHEVHILLFEKIYKRLERGFSTENITYANLSFSHYLAEFIFNDLLHPAYGLREPDKIEDSIDFMRNNIDKILDLKTIASAINLSPSHFSAVFKKKTGTSPIDYFNQLKIQETTQYLLFTNLRIKEIAQKIGIDDPYYFSRVFSNIMGISPKKYRENRTT